MKAKVCQQPLLVTTIAESNVTQQQQELAHISLSCLAQAVSEQPVALSLKVAITLQAIRLVRHVSLAQPNVEKFFAEKIIVARAKRLDFSLI